MRETAVVLVLVEHTRWVPVGVVRHRRGYHPVVSLGVWVNNAQNGPIGTVTLVVRASLAARVVLVVRAGLAVRASLVVRTVLAARAVLVVHAGLAVRGVLAVLIVPVILVALVIVRPSRARMNGGKKLSSILLEPA